MKGSNKKRRSEFENSWQEAFDHAEMKPDDRVWKNLDASLTQGDNNKYKKRIVLYKWVAAASLLIGLGLSYFAVDNIYFTDTISSISDNSNFNNTDGEEEEGNRALISPENNTGDLKNAASADDKVANKSFNEKSPVDTEASGMGKDETQPGQWSDDKNSDANAIRENKEKNNAVTPDVVKTEEFKILVAQAEERDEPSFSTERNSDNKLLSEERRLVSGMNELSQLGHDLEFQSALYQMNRMYKIPGIVPVAKSAIEEENDTEPNKIFAGLSFSSGVFDPNFQEGNTTLAQAAFDNAASPVMTNQFKQVANHNEETDPSYSYALGINVGTRISKRWVLQGGIQYGNYSATTSTTAFVEDRVNKKRYPLHLFTNAADSYESTKQISITRNYELKSNFEFASIPIKAGYVLIDKKVSFMISAGIGTEIFIENNMVDQTNQFEDIQVTPGSDSPYRNVFFNGLMGAELSYHFAGNYTISLAPNYSMAINSFTKSKTGFSSNPQSLSLSLGIRYFFEK